MTKTSPDDQRASRDQEFLKAYLSYLDGGFDKNALNRAGQTPLDIARKRNNRSLVELLSTDTRKID